MKPKKPHETWTIQELTDARDNNHLRVNPVYQRGEVWDRSQILLLIDSLLRGYQIPLIYLRKVTEEIREGESSVYYDIIDGQQRINALRSFRGNVIIRESRSGDSGDTRLGPLYDPTSKTDNAKFPVPLQREECPWAGKTFNSLDEEDQNNFLKKQIFVTVMECGDDEARDMFIRLQGGSPLTDQEVRDAWLSNFSEIVLSLGGKPQLRLPGHDFFLNLMKKNPAGDRGKTRQFAAQLLMTFLRKRSGDTFSSIKTGALDDYYRQQAKLPIDSPEIHGFKDILKLLVKLLGGDNRPPLKNHDALHLVMFVDMLLQEKYAPTDTWQQALPGAVDKFSANVVKAGKVKDLTGKESDDFKDFWNYHRKTSNKADAADTICGRHVIYERQMLKFIGPDVRPKDTQQAYTATQREAVYYRDKKQCRAEHCRANDRNVAWSDAVVHHIKPYSQGGRTSLENGALMHHECHKAFHAEGGSVLPAPTDETNNGKGKKRKKTK